MLVIFDCDGVLVDSEPLANTCFARALQREGLDWNVEDTMRRLMGRSMKSCVEIVEGELGRALPADFVDRLQADTMQAFRDAPLRTVPGVVEARQPSVPRLGPVGVRLHSLPQDINAPVSLTRAD